MFGDSFIGQLKTACDIENIVAPYVDLKRSGRSKSGLCPFHLEKTPSFHVYGETQSFYCFGCGAGGDIITFVMRYQNLDYVEAVKYLASQAGLKLPDEIKNDKTAELKTLMLEMNRETARFYHSYLISGDGRTALNYLHERGIGMKLVKRYGLGFAPDSWHILTDYLKGKGYREDDIISASLAGKKNNRIFDQFRNRIMFPIIDLRGGVIGFGGRVLDDSKPKYLNSSDTLVFKKSSNLFSLNFAKNSKEKRIILAEGYMDVIAMNGAGFMNAVATLGTAITQEQAKLLSGYAEEVIIAYDSDDAGRKATTRASALLSQTGVTTKILILSGAKDPDEYIKKYGALKFKLLLDNSENIIQNTLNVLKKKYQIGNSEVGVSDEENRTHYLNEAIEALINIPDPIERDIYAGRLSGETGVLKETILSRISSLIRKNKNINDKKEWRRIKSGVDSVDRVNIQKQTNMKEAMAEEGIISFFFRNLDYKDYILSKIKPEDFVTEFNKRIFCIITEKLQNNITPNLSNIVTDFTVSEMGNISGILARYNKLENTKTQLDDYIRVLLDYKNTKSDREFGEIPPLEIQKLFENKKRTKH